MIADNDLTATRNRKYQPSWVPWLFKLVRLGVGARVFFVGGFRRRHWFLESLSAGKLINLLTAMAEFALKREKLSALPVAVKIDISPLCNLHCTWCVHAEPHGRPDLEKQDFRGKQRMSVTQYRRIIDEIKGRSMVVSLYYLGDPIVHPDLDEICSITHDAGLNVHISTNFSVPLSDARIQRIVTSGLTHLTVCVDGLSQEKYERTRVGGRIDRVLSNLRRVCECRRKLQRSLPQIEVQYIKYQHNVDELEEARRVVNEMGVDRFSDFWGGLENHAERGPEHYTVFGPKKPSLMPQCYWPHFAMLIKYNGDVIPCCEYRLGQQYTNTDAPLAQGNVFATSVRAVWNSIAYQEARRLVSNPQSVTADPALENHFCHGCSFIFDSDYNKGFRTGDKYSFEELYEIGPTGRPKPRRSTPALNEPREALKQPGACP